MAYYNNDRGYAPNGGGYPNRGYDQPRYDDRNTGYRPNNWNNDRGSGRQDFRPNQCYDNSAPRQFNAGDDVIHKQTGIKMRVVKLGREQYECRKPDLSSEYFYEDELELATE